MQKKLQIKVCIKTLNNYFQFLFQTLGKNCSSESVPFKLDLLANISTKQFKSLSLCGFNAKTPRTWVRIWRNPSWMSTSRGVCDVYTFFIQMFSTFPYCFNGSWSWLYSMIRWLVESCGVIDEPEPIWPKPTGSDGTLCTLLYRRLFSLSLLISPPSYKGDEIP